MSPVSVPHSLQCVYECIENQHIRTLGECSPVNSLGQEVGLGRLKEGPVGQPQPYLTSARLTHQLGAQFGYVALPPGTHLD